MTPSDPAQEDQEFESDPQLAMDEGPTPGATEPTPCPPTAPQVPLHKRIPKIALNFTKWKLQQRMVTDLREIKDPTVAQKKIAKYT